MRPRSAPVWLPAVATSIALRPSRSRPVWKKIALPSDAKAGEKAFALVAPTAWMALTCSPMCSTGPLGAFAGASARITSSSRTISRATAGVRERARSRPSVLLSRSSHPNRSPQVRRPRFRATPARSDGFVAARRSVIRSPRAKPTANDATSATAVSMAHRRDECTGELGSPSAPKDLNIGATAAIRCGGSLKEPPGLRTTSVGRDGTAAGRGAAGEGPAAGRLSGVGAAASGAAIGRAGARRAAGRLSARRGSLPFRTAPARARTRPATRRSALRTPRGARDGIAKQRRHVAGTSWQSRQQQVGDARHRGYAVGADAGRRAVGAELDVLGSRNAAGVCHELPCGGNRFVRLQAHTSP